MIQSWLAYEILPIFNFNWIVYNPQKTSQWPRFWVTVHLEVSHWRHGFFRLHLRHLRETFLLKMKFNSLPSCPKDFFFAFQLPAVMFFQGLCLLQLLGSVLGNDVWKRYKNTQLVVPNGDFHPMEITQKTHRSWWMWMDVPWGDLVIHGVKWVKLYITSINSLIIYMAI